MSLFSAGHVQGPTLLSGGVVCTQERKQVLGAGWFGETLMPVESTQNPCLRGEWDGFHVHISLTPLAGTSVSPDGYTATLTGFAQDSLGTQSPTCYFPSFRVLIFLVCACVCVIKAQAGGDIIFSLTISVF